MILAMMVVYVFALYLIFNVFKWVQPSIWNRIYVMVIGLFLIYCVILVINIRIKPGDAAELAFDTYPGRTFAGKMKVIFRDIPQRQVVPSGQLLSTDLVSMDASLSSWISVAMKKLPLPLVRPGQQPSIRIRDRPRHRYARPSSAGIPG